MTSKLVRESIASLLREVPGFEVVEQVPRASNDLGVSSYLDCRKTTRG